jgi:hypothetical protein
MSAADVAIQLGIVTQQINRYGTIFLLLFGVIGNLLNCLVFTRQTVRTNPCAVYFLAASSVNLIVFLAAFIPGIIDGWSSKADLKETISSLCQFTLVILFTSRSIAAWMIAFATIDRYLVSSSNIHRRQMSNLKNTYRCIIFICILSFIGWIPIIFCSDANIVRTPLKCFPKSNACFLYANVAQALIMIIIPVILMLIFGFCTIRNIHQTRQVAPTRSNEQPTISRNRRSENSLTKMLFIQVLVLTLLTLPFGMTTFYMCITFYQDKSLVESAVENFLFNLFFLVAFIPNCISFFLFTLSGSLFRKTFVDIGKRILRYF